MSQKKTSTKYEYEVTVERHSSQLQGFDGLSVPRPKGDGWELVSTAASPFRLFFTWRRPVTS